MEIRANTGSDRSGIQIMPLMTFLAEQGLGQAEGDHFRRAARLVMLLTGLVVAMLVGAATMSSLNGRDEVLDHTRMEMTTLAHSLAEHAARAVAGADRGLRTVQETIADDETTPALLHGVMKQMSAELPQVRSMFQLDADGRSVADAARLPPRPLVGAEREYFQAQRDPAARQPFISLPVRSALNNEWIIGLSRRMANPDGSFAGVVVAGLDPTYFSRFFASLVQPGGSIGIFRDDGRVLLREPFSETMVAKDLAGKLNLARIAEHGPERITASDGIERIIAARPVQGQPLYVATAMPVEVALRDWRDRSIWLACGTALACLAIIALGILLSYELLRLGRRDAALAHVTGLMDAMLGAIGQGIAITDARGRIVLANPQAAELSGTPADMMRPGMPFMMARPPASDGRDPPNAARVIHLANGRKTAVRHDAMPGGHTVTIFTDVTAEKAAEAKLTRLAMLDPLTELPNRRSFIEAAEREMNRVRRHAGRACLAILDIDHFKQINDEHGHQAGDMILRSLAELWGDMLRSSDTLARYGGEEFIVLMPETEPGVALRLLERLRQATSARHLGAGPADLRVTVSIGLAALAPEGHIEDAIEAADTALYQAKAEGRDRVRSAPPPPPTRRRLG